MKQLLLCLVSFFYLVSTAFPGEVDVVTVEYQRVSDGTYNFDVTLKHSDAGWDHYADRWEILAPDGKILGTRMLAHPHVDEQPFTRSLSGVKIPADVKKVEIRGHDSIHGFGVKTIVVDLD
jgi:hypothetical protein